MELYCSFSCWVTRFFTFFSRMRSVIFLLLVSQLMGVSIDRVKNLANNANEYSDALTFAMKPGESGGKESWDKQLGKCEYR